MKAKRILKRMTALTAIAAGLGVAALAAGALTGTVHNIVTGLMFLAIGYASYNDDKDDL